jgi:hypothetical protein
MVFRAKKGYFITVLLLTLAAAVLFANEFISIEIWCELEPMVDDKETHSPLTEEESYKLIFEEARFILSGMIYGFQFTYIPSDKTRGVEEFFEVTPIAEIPWSDKNLRLIHREISENRLYGRFTYELEPFQESRLKSWQTLTIPSAMGKGEGKINRGMREKKTAAFQAIKDAIRNFLRPRILNKPREIKGEAIFLECPESIIRAGNYSTTVKVKIDIKKVVPYTIY